MHIFKGTISAIVVLKNILIKVESEKKITTYEHTYRSAFTGHLAPLCKCD